MRKIAIILIIILVIGIVGGYFIYQRTQIKNLGEITYGWNHWPGVLPYLVAYDQGFFKQEGLSVKMVEGDSYIKHLNDLIVGKIDFSGDIALIDIVEKASKGNKLKVVLATDYSNGADGIVAKKEIKSINELKGKKVAVEMGTLGEYLLHDALGKEDIDLSEIQEINFSAQEAAQVFIRGEVDAAVTYEPSYSQAVNDGNGWRIYTSADSPGLIIDVLTFGSDFVAKYPAKVSAVARSYFKAIDFIDKNPDQAYEIGAKYFKITANEFKSQIAGIKQMNFNDNQDIMSYGTGLNSIHGLIRQADLFLQEKSTIERVVDSTEIIDPRFVRELVK